MDAATQKGTPTDGWRWLVLALSLSALAALTYYGVRQPAPVMPLLGWVRSAPSRWAGKDLVFESVRVVESLPGEAFLGESVGSRWSSEARRRSPLARCSRSAPPTIPPAESSTSRPRDRCRVG